MSQKLQDKSNDYEKRNDVNDLKDYFCDFNKR
jgi:hypothetical protein